MISITKSTSFATNARRALQKKGSLLVNISTFLTGFGCCLGYCIALITSIPYFVRINFLETDWINGVTVAIGIGILYLFVIFHRDLSFISKMAFFICCVFFLYFGIVLYFGLSEFFTSHFEINYFKVQKDLDSITTIAIVMFCLPTYRIGVIITVAYCRKILLTTFQMKLKEGSFPTLQANITKIMNI